MVVGRKKHLCQGEIQTPEATLSLQSRRPPHVSFAPLLTLCLTSRATSLFSLSLPKALGHVLAGFLAHRAKHDKEKGMYSHYHTYIIIIVRNACRFGETNTEMNTIIKARLFSPLVFFNHIIIICKNQERE